MVKMTMVDGSVLEATVEEYLQIAAALAETGEVVVEKILEEEYVKIAKSEAKAGDFVKFTVDSLDRTAGNYYEITDVDEDDDLVFTDDGGDEGYVVRDEGDFEVYRKVGAKAEEVAKLDEEAKWAKIGRKPREFKEGDIAEVLCQVHADIPIGTIGTITKVDDDETVRVGANGVTIGNWHHLSEVKLITPVEARFDRA